MKEKLLVTLVTASLVVSLANTALLIKAGAVGGGAAPAKPKVELAHDNAIPSEYDKGMTYDEAMKSDKPMMAMFYVDWCGYCKRFAPNIPVLNKMYKKKMNIVMINCEDAKNHALQDQYKIMGYPTFYIIDPAKDKQIEINGIGSLEALTPHLDKYLEERK